MRFFQRFVSHSRPSVRTLFVESQNSNVTYEAMSHLMLRYNFHPLQKSQTYVPKCLSATSPSDVLIGADLEEVEDFSAGCWLQDHLHQFGNGISELVTPSARETQDIDNDSIDSQTCSGSDVTTEADDDYPDINDEYRPLLQFQPASISRYTMVQEPPPYGFDEPPPSYEEATQGYADRSSFSSSSSSMDFVLY
ncbi:uncharacterized protein LOC110449455 [Mizuhopecten yessoensis]|uniref:Uncharacterized protein n=1 Tax=Mizuhopecten yessoensis TaxID=6573 RepID=A0A210QR85_MIZYE|nr:uncharacterized protein LOC110449455 [Mizuhopecten yessoensis]OWF51231.1 hypothetical protein KP79_PYT13348 [Mizuhopecten yessoensis]